MKVYAFVSQKGGAGKSTLCRQLACQAAEPLELGRAILIDRDPQQTTAKWWGRRQHREPLPPRQPELLELGNSSLPQAVDALRGVTPGGIFIDTRPAIAQPEAEAASLADRIIVPVRPSADDLEAVQDTLMMIRRLGALERTILVVNASKNPQRAASARDALSRWPVTVCPIAILDRAAFQDAALRGLWVEELGQPGREASDQLLRVWLFIKDHLRTEGGLKA